MIPNPYQQYQTMQVQTATTGDIVVLLYDAVVRALTQALAALDQRWLDVAHEKLVRAQDIVLELNTGLDMERGGELAQNLRDLYLYHYRTLVLANVRKDPELIRTTMKQLVQLRGAWRTVVHGDAGAAVATPVLVGGRSA
jgi:flagellar protein FliS